MLVSWRRWIRSVGWWMLLLICVLYAGFAIAMSGIEVASWIDPEVEGKFRALPRAFVVHALGGTLALLVGPLQFHGGLRRRFGRVHRVSGRIYVVSTWISSVTAAGLAPFFDVPAAAKVSFGVLAVAWFATTTVGLRQAMVGRITAHQEWMLRSFALSLFFITGSLWMEASRALPYPEDVTYPLAVFLGWALNLGVAELWIRAGCSAPRRTPKGAPGEHPGTPFLAL